jgi:hypothetical protein
MRADRHRRLCRLHRIEQLGAGKEHDAGAGEGEHPAAVARIDLEIVAPALDRAQRDRIDDQPRIEARLDHEKAANLA